MSEASSASLPQLDAELAVSGRAAAESRSRELPERVLQFGEGNFLRAFADWMLERMNQQGLFQGRAVLVQPIADGLAERINAQDGLYTVLLRGLEGGHRVESREVVSAVSRCINPYRDFDAYLACAKLPDLRFVVSNTTEAGIRTEPNDRKEARPAVSFPGKLTQLLYARFEHFEGDRARGLVLLPCELIERNGDALKRAVLQTAEAWNLPPAFSSWVGESCVFTNTLVDRIVTGYPKDEVEAISVELGYRDSLLVAGEIFHCWVIESPVALESELPLAAAGLNVIWTSDMTPYRERKVRILNGAHTLVALAAFLAGKDTVRECMDDPLFRSFVEHALRDEILPTLTLPEAELVSFAESVLERFGNPFIRHQLLSISLNSVSKYKARILGTVLDYERRFGKTPQRLAFALAALIAFYRGREIRDNALIGDRAGAPYSIQDEAPALRFFQEAWAEAPDGPCSREFCETLARAVLAREEFWGRALDQELPDFRKAVSEHLHAITNGGVRSAVERLAV